jgi:hypothetical protein
MNSYWGALLTILHVTRMEKVAEDEALTARLEVGALAAPTWDSTDHYDACSLLLFCLHQRFQQKRDRGFLRQTRAVK